MSSLPSLLDLIDIVNTKLRDRTKVQLAQLNTFFISTNIAHVLKNDMQLGEITLDTLLFFLTQFIEIKTYEKEDVIYFEGDKGEFIYVLLQGSISTYKIVMNETEMNAVEYYHSLMEINHPFVLQKTIEENSEVFPINKVEDVANMNEIIYKVILILKAYNGDIEGVKDMLNLKNLPMETFDFISVLKEEETIEEFYQDQASMMNEAEMFYFKILADSTKKEIKLCEFQLITNLDVNKYFGNYKLGNFDHLRNETAISNKISIVLAINRRLYSTCILTIEIKKLTIYI